MKKLRTRPPRFVALDNRAVDDLRLSVLDVGLLAVALRCPDGSQFTVASLARKRRPGREALTGAMRNLVTCGYVVKLKIQDAGTGTWRTEFSVADVPFSREDVEAMLTDVAGARAIRVEPLWLDPRSEPAEQGPAPARNPRPGSRPARETGSRHPGTTSTNAQEAQVAPTDGIPTVGEPIVGGPSAKERTLHLQDSSLSAGTGPDGGIRAAPARDTNERETPAPHRTQSLATAAALPPLVAAAADGGRPAAAPPATADARTAGDRVADAWAKAREQRKIPVPVLGRKRVARAATALAASGTPEEVLLQAATDMARQPNWTNLERHLEHWTPPAAVPRPVEPEPYCDECDYGWLTTTDGRAHKCPCRKPTARAEHWGTGGVTGLTFGLGSGPTQQLGGPS
ncbi:hypothetical protein OHT93_36840 [Streptomyces sp. NBC_00191]|uniref:hypothetical protein n=1 Tax=Streptomyces sp. NBC_00191 TaxID=2975674 RepID=UPI003255D27A